jgi:hypothetical protein
MHWRRRGKSSIARSKLKSQYSEVVSFTIPTDSRGVLYGDLALSPDFTKFAFAKTVDGQSHAGWLACTPQMFELTAGSTTSPQEITSKGAEAAELKRLPQL